MRTSINGRHWHIDNGGISVDIFDDGGCNEVKISTSYYGYPFVSSSLFGISNKQMREIGELLVETANLMDGVKNKPNVNSIDWETIVSKAVEECQLDSRIKRLLSESNKDCK